MCGWLSLFCLLMHIVFHVIKSLWLTSFLLFQGHIRMFFVRTFQYQIKEVTIFNPSCLCLTERCRSTAFKRTLVIAHLSVKVGRLMWRNSTSYSQCWKWEACQECYGNSKVTKVPTGQEYWEVTPYSADNLFHILWPDNRGTDQLQWPDEGNKSACRAVMKERNASVVHITMNVITFNVRFRFICQ